MLIKSSKQLIRLQQTVNELENNFSLSSEERNKLFSDFLSKEFPRASDYLKGYYFDLLSNPDTFEVELHRLINNELIDAAIKQGKTTFYSLAPCSSINQLGRTCGNTLRYVSNRGCYLCQNLNSDSKLDKAQKVEMILGGIPIEEISSNKSKFVSLIMEKTLLKKSAAYRLIAKHLKNESLYQKNQAFDEEHPTPKDILNSVFSKAGVTIGSNIFDEIA